MEYQYRALNTEGTVIAGVIVADSQRGALRDLKRQGLNVVNLDRAADRSTLRRRRGGKAGVAEVSVLVQQLSVLLRSGVPLDEAVDSLAASVTHPELIRQCAEMGAALRRGLSFSQALAESGLNVPAYFHSLAKAGELTGQLGTALEDGLRQWEYERETRKKLVNSLIYPTILVSCGVVSVMLIFVLVVPKFVKILARSRAKIPFLARAVLESGKFLNEHIIALGAGSAVIIFSIMVFLANKDLRQKGWAALLATLLENRVELLYALELALRGVTISPLKAQFSTVGKAVRSGASLAQAVQSSKSIPTIGHNLIKVGERSGELPAMLRSLAGICDESVKTRMQRFLMLIEPAAIIIIGGVVGLIMAGVMLAITSMNQVTL